MDSVVDWVSLNGGRWFVLGILRRREKSEAMVSRVWVRFTWIVTIDAMGFCYKVSSQGLVNFYRRRTML